MEGKEVKRQPSRARHGRNTEKPEAEDKKMKKRQEVEEEEEAKKPEVQAPPPGMVPFFQIFTFADPIDCILLIFGSIAAIIVGVGMMFYNKVMGESFDAIREVQTDPDGPDHVFKHMIQFFILGGVLFFAGWTEVACFQITGERQAMKLRKRYIEAVLKKNMAWFDTEESTGSILYNLDADATTLQTTISDKVGNFLSSIATFVSCLALSLTVVWKVALVSTTIVPVIATTGGIYAYVMMGLANKTKENYEIAGTIAEETLSQVRTVFSFVGENRSIQRYSNALARSLRAGYQSGLVKGLGVGIMWGSIFLSYCLILWYGGVAVRNGEASGGKVLTTIFAVVIASLFLGQSLTAVAAFANARVAVFRVKKLLEEDSSASSKHTGDKDRSQRKYRLKAVHGQIELRSIDFAYPARKDVQILKNFSVTIPAGKTVALVGGSGSGKSTIIQLIERFYEPDRGTVCLDGHEIRNLDLKWLRNQMGLVSQEPALFATTIKENILYGKADATMEEIVEAAKAANAYKFITELQDGFNTEVGDRGTQMSGGQKQRIAITRAMVKNPPILLLDEATSALDTSSEQIVQEALNSLMVGRTTVVIAHRLTTIMKADLIVVLQGGKIIEKGSHTSLMDLNGAYSKMVQMQEGQATPEPYTRSSAPSPAYTPGRISILSGGESPQVPWRRGQTYASPAYADRSVAFSPISNVAMMMSPFRSPIATPTRNLNSIRAFESRDFGPRSIESRDFGPRSIESRSRVSDFSMGELESFDDSSDMDARSQTRDEQSGGGFLRLLKMNPSEWKYGIVGTMGAFLAGLIMPGFAIMLSTLIGIYYNPDFDFMKHEIATKVIYMALLGVLAPEFYALQHYFLGMMGENIAQRMRERVFAVLMKNEVGFFDKDEHSSSQLASRIAGDSAHIKSTITDRLGVPASTISLLAASYTYSFIMQTKIAALTIPIFPILACAGVVEKIVAGGVTGDLAKAQERSSQLAGEAVGNIRTVAAFNAQSRVVERFGKELEGPLRRSFRRGHVGGLALGVTQCAQYFCFGSLLWYGGRLVARGEATTQEILSAFLTLIVACFTTAETLSLAPELLKGSAAMTSMYQLLDRPTQIDADDRKGQSVQQIRGHIEFQQVRFSYPERPNVVIFRNLNLTVLPGRSVALVGPSGSGKSSIIALIERFYDPLSGCVRIDGEDIKRYNLKALRKHIGLVQQEPALFAVSVLDNILYGNDRASEAEVVQAAKAANAHSFISALPHGYKTEVGERGTQLSGGQKQRIAIARAVLKNATILLLDEATSALDAESERIVQEALDKLMRQRTTVIVAHRLSTVRNADTIAVVQGGEIVEQGRHTDLIRDPLGPYSRLVQLQLTSAT
ncbi:hypothetical protein Mapa_009713 [Marchantia paleacea]|nr:hypothetical protein Mapa_009713 [Marchantia paleacea]